MGSALLESPVRTGSGTRGGSQAGSGGPTSPNPRSEPEALRQKERKGGGEKAGAGAQYEATDKDGDTPLNVAIQMGHTDMVTLLKQHGSLISD